MLKYANVGYKNLFLGFILSSSVMFSLNAAVIRDDQIEYEKILNAQNRLLEENREITFDEILKYTLDNNDILNAEREKTKATETQKFKTFGINALPDVGIELGYGSTDFKEKMGSTVFKGTGSTNSNRIYLQEPIFKSGRTVTQLKIVDSQINMQKNRLVQVEQEVLFDTIQATIELLQTKAIFDLTIKNEESLKNNYDYVSARRKVGRTTITDLSLAKARYNSARTDTIIANTNYLNARANFLKITKINPNLINVDYDNIFNTCFYYDILFDKVLESALLKNPQYKIAKNNYEMNKSNLKFAKTKFLPELYLNAQMRNSDKTDLISSRESSVSLNLKIPLFQSGVEYSTHRETGHLLNESKFNLNDIKDTLINQCLAIFDEFLASKSIVMSSKTYRDSSKIALENTIAEEKVGKATLVDVLDRRKEYFDTEISYLKYKTNVIEYYYSLRLLMGELNLIDLLN
ncbi:MAG: TolC family protein [Rickettsiales bacterium]|nr:TolC family protein [Rickettsiales bacterium]